MNLSCWVCPFIYLIKDKQHKLCWCCNTIWFNNDYTVKPAHNGIAWGRFFSEAGCLCCIQVLEIKDFVQLHTHYISSCVKGWHINTYIIISISTIKFSAHKLLTEIWFSVSILALQIEFKLQNDFALVKFLKFVLLEYHDMISVCTAHVISWKFLFAPLCPHHLSLPYFAGGSPRTCWFSLEKLLLCLHYKCLHNLLVSIFICFLIECLLEFLDLLSFLSSSLT